ncbi:uncharacterized protein LOC143914697 [Arctopsyche grandis]|uniref:uncharacterized protein LOC143914697 n=1 Tax=Arctopsyche grandis TaxID=121162 RepID=UPI00406D90F6
MGQIHVRVKSIEEPSIDIQSMSLCISDCEVDISEPLKFKGHELNRYNNILAEPEGGEEMEMKFIPKRPVAVCSISPHIDPGTHESQLVILSGTTDRLTLMYMQVCTENCTHETDPRNLIIRNEGGRFISRAEVIEIVIGDEFDAVLRDSNFNSLSTPDEELPRRRRKFWMISMLFQYCCLSSYVNRIIDGIVLPRRRE